MEPRHEDTVLFVVNKDTPGLTVKGEWDPLGMRGTNSRDLILKDVFVTRDDLLMPRGIFGKTLPNWPHMMATLSPTYMGVAQGAYDFYRKPVEIDDLALIVRRALNVQQIERENARLKRAVAELTLDKQILKEAAEGNF
mgnify:CR=1 FL=1